MINPSHILSLLKPHVSCGTAEPKPCSRSGGDVFPFVTLHSYTISKDPSCAPYPMGLFVYENSFCFTVLQNPALPKTVSCSHHIAQTIINKRTMSLSSALPQKRVHFLSSSGPSKTSLSQQASALLQHLTLSGLV